MVDAFDLWNKMSFRSLNTWRLTPNSSGKINDFLKSRFSVHCTSKSGQRTTNTLLSSIGWPLSLEHELKSFRMRLSLRSKRNGHRHKTKWNRIRKEIANLVNLNEAVNEWIAHQIKMKSIKRKGKTRTGCGNGNGNIHANESNQM